MVLVVGVCEYSVRGVRLVFVGTQPVGLPALVENFLGVWVLRVDSFGARQRRGFVPSPPASAHVLSGPPASLLWSFGL